MSGPPIDRGALNMCCPGMGWVGIFWGRDLGSDLDQPSEPVGDREVLRFVGALGGGLPAAPCNGWLCSWAQLCSGVERRKTSDMAAFIMACIGSEHGGRYSEQRSVCRTPLVQVKSVQSSETRVGIKGGLGMPIHS